MNKININGLILSCVALVSVSLLSACASEPNSEQAPTKAKSNIKKINKTSPVPPEYTNRQLTGAWQIEFIKTKPVIDRSPAQLVFLANNKLSGSATCNNLSASYNVDNIKQTLAFSPAAVTRKMCPAALMEQETRFLSVLNKISHYQIKQSMLYLFNEKDVIMLKASKVE